MSAGAWLSWFVSVQLAGAAVFAAAGACDLLLRRRSAALRRELWALAFAVALALPLARLALPVPALELGAPGWWLAGWGVGFAWLGARLVRGHARARGAVVRGEAVASPVWRRELERDGVVVRSSEELDTPCVVGLWRPALVIPRALLGASPEERRAVLAHERAHVDAGDGLVLALASLARAFYWITPAPWWALRRLRALAEDAADDAVLREGVASSRYAAQLLALARARRARAAGGPTEQLRRRIVAVLDARRRRAAPRLGLPGLVGLAALIAASATACEARSEGPGVAQGR